MIEGKFWLGDAEPTAPQVIHNCNLLEKIWLERVKPEEVNLESWSCGAVACLGGHIARWPEFQELPGAYMDNQGMPCFSTRMDPELDLFGNSWLFSARSTLLEPTGTDYEVALKRIRYCRELAEKGKIGISRTDVEFP